MGPTEYGAPDLPYAVRRVPYEKRKTLDIWPDGKRMALLVYLATEQWQWDIHEAFMTTVVRVAPGETVPSLSTRTAITYGMEVGMPRVMDVLESRGVSLTIISNATTVGQHPETMREALRRGHHVEGHGYSQGRPMTVLSPEDQAFDIARATTEIEKILGERPQGWIGPGAMVTTSAMSALAAAGYGWNGDLQDDDLPYFVDFPEATMVEIPYRMIGNINDVFFTNAQKSPAQAREHLFSAFDESLEQAQHTPMHFVYGIHAHVSGRPEWAKLLGDFLDHALSRDDVWVATYRDVAAWWRHRFGDGYDN